jgi:hypothetical protein
MGEFHPGMSWSLSRQRLFERCRRAYFLHYYAAAGSEEDASVAGLRHCKHTLTVDQWLERTVQAFIGEQLIKQSTPATEAQLARQMREAARRSQRRIAQGQTKDRLDSAATERLISQACDSAAQAISRWRRSAMLGALLAEPRPHWKPIETIASFALGDLTIWCRFDAAFSRGDGNLMVINWRLRRPRNRDAARMLTLMAARRWQIQPDRIRVCTEPLLDDAPPQFDVFSAAELVDMQDRILNSAAEMRSCMDDVTADIASEDAFALTENPATCATCRFRSVCPGPATV